MVTVHRKYRELFSGTERFTSSTRGLLERSIGRALFGYRGGIASIRAAVGRAAQELRVDGASDAEIITILATIVENAGRECRADRTSLLSGEPLWLSVQARVIESAERQLTTIGG